MKPSDKREFAALLSATLEVYGQSLSEAAVGIWWAALERFELGQVRAALSAHVQLPQGRFAPKPADLIAWIDASTANGHPGPEEAWSMVQHAIGDERATVVLTEHMRSAFFACDGMDKIPARMTFIEVYKRELAKGGAPKWAAVLGWDVIERERSVMEALEQGRLTAAQVHALLPYTADDGRTQLLEKFPALKALT